MKQQIGEFLATLRKANGYTQQEIAEKLGISNKTLSNWECDKALPDILLLPALAETYGVTVDEILAGERKPCEQKGLSNRAEKNLLRSKLAKFDIGAWILTGLIIVAFLVSFLGACFEILIDAVELSDEVAIWFMIGGVVVVALCLSLLFLIWHNAQISADDSAELYPSYCIILRKKLVTCLYTLIVWTFMQALAAFYLADFDSLLGGYSDKVITVVICFLLPQILLAAGWWLFKKAIVRYGGEKGRHYLRTDRKYFFTVAFFGLIPAVIISVVSLILVLVPSILISNLQVAYIAVAVLATDLAVCVTLCLKRRFAHYAKF